MQLSSNSTKSFSASVTPVSGSSTSSSSQSDMSPLSTTTSTSSMTQPSRRGEEDGLGPLLDLPLNVVLGSDDSNDESDDDESCDEEEIDDDCSYWQQQRRGETQGNHCSDALSAVMAQLMDIKAIIEKPKSFVPVASAKRQWKDQLDGVVDQEHAYGNQGKDLTSEQKAALYALVKGIDGYQASSDGATNTDQTEQEIWGQRSQADGSAPFLSSLSPYQLQDLFTLLGGLLHQNRPGKPSVSTLGSQGGQSVSEASWMIPSEGTLEDAGYSVQSNADSTKDTASSAPNGESLVLLSKWEDIRKQEQDLARQLQASSAHSMMKSSFQSEASFHLLSDQELDEVTSKLLADQSKTASTAMLTTSTMMTSTVVSPTVSPSTILPPTAAASTPAVITPKATPQRRVFTRGEAESHVKESESALTMKLLEMGGFDRARLDEALHSTSLAPHIPGNAQSSSLLDVLLDGATPFMRQRLLQELHRSAPSS